MLHEFCEQDVDILLPQEVTHEGFGAFAGYNSYINIGAERRGTTILTKETIPLENIKKITVWERISDGNFLIAGWYEDIYSQHIMRNRGLVGGRKGKTFRSGVTVLLVKSAP